MITPRTQYERLEDMSPDGKLVVMMEDDGDMILKIVQTHEGFSGRPFAEPIFASVQFCTLAGGGHSPAVRRAIRQLAEAIERDNVENPDPRAAESQKGTGE